MDGDRISGYKFLEDSDDHLQAVFCDFTKSTSDLIVGESLVQIRLGR